MNHSIFTWNLRTIENMSHIVYDSMDKSVTSLLVFSCKKPQSDQSQCLMNP